MNDYVIVFSQTWSLLIGQKILDENVHKSRRLASLSLVSTFTRPSTQTSLRATVALHATLVQKGADNGSSTEKPFLSAQHCFISGLSPRDRLLQLRSFPEYFSNWRLWLTLMHNVAVRVSLLDILN